MSDLINRKLLISKLANSAVKFATYADWEHCCDVIESVERERGEWIKIDKYDKESNVQCSVCFEEFDYIDGVCYLCHGYKLPLFCPNCGADMRKGVE